MTKTQEPPQETTEEQNKETTEEPPKVTPQSLVSEDLVRAALTADKGSDAEILSWEVKDFTNKGDNYACVVTSASVRFRQANTEGEVTYVAKCSPCRPVAAFNDFSTFLFDKEAKFYEKLVPLINAELKAAGQEPMRMADCYVTHLVKSKEVILLRDLRPDGFKMFDRKKGMDVAHATLVMRELGRLHAASTLVQAKMTEPMEEKYPFLKKDFVALSESPDKEDEALEELMSPVFYTNMKLGMAMAERVSGYDKVVDWLRRHARKVNDLLKESVKKSPPFDVLCHGDCWNNNILFNDWSGSRAQQKGGKKARQPSLHKNQKAKDKVRREWTAGGRASPRPAGLPQSLASHRHQLPHVLEPKRAGEEGQPGGIPQVLLRSLLSSSLGCRPEDSLHP